MNGFRMQRVSNLKKKGVLTMKKALLLMVAVMFVAGLGTAYAAGNGITDFSGRTNDRLEIEHVGSVAADSVYEGTAPGSKRLVEDFNTSGKAYDTFEIGNHGPAKPGMRQNWGAKTPSYNAYDTFEIGR